MKNLEHKSYWRTSDKEIIHETDFADRGATLRFKATFSRFGSQTSTPTQGINGQSLQSYTLKADLEDMPLVVNESVDGQLVDVLNDIRATVRGDSVWAVEENSGLTVEWTQPGQRASSRDPDISRYDVTKDAGAVVEKAIVRGARQTVTDERWTSTHGSAVDLDSANLTPESERVYDPTAEGRLQFERGADYTMDYEQGTITALSSGDLDDATEYAIDYDFVPKGSFTASGVSSPVEWTYQFPELGAQRGCEQAAERIVKSAKTPRIEAEYVVPGADPDWSVVEDLDPSAIDQFGKTFLIADQNTELGQTALRLESREREGEIVNDLRERLRSVSTRV